MGVRTHVPQSIVGFWLSLGIHKAALALQFQLPFLWQKESFPESGEVGDNLTGLQPVALRQGWEAWVRILPLPYSSCM